MIHVNSMCKRFSKINYNNELKCAPLHVLRYVNIFFIVINDKGNMSV